MDEGMDENYRQSALNYSQELTVKFTLCDVSKDKSEIVASATEELDSGLPFLLCHNFPFILTPA